MLINADEGSFPQVTLLHVVKLERDSCENAAKYQNQWASATHLQTGARPGAERPEALGLQDES